MWTPCARLPSPFCRSQLARALSRNGKDSKPRLPPPSAAWDCLPVSGPHHLPFHCHRFASLCWPWNLAKEQESWVGTTSRSSPTRSFLPAHSGISIYLAPTLSLLEQSDCRPRPGRAQIAPESGVTSCLPFAGQQRGPVRPGHFCGHEGTLCPSCIPPSRAVQGTGIPNETRYGSGRVGN